MTTKAATAGARPADAIEIASDMNRLKARLAQAGLFRTMHKMDEATRILGWEIAGDLEGYEKYEKTRLKHER